MEIKIFWEIYKPPINNNPRKTIVKRSQWKHKVSKTKDFSDILKFKSHKNVIVKLDRKVKINYFVNVETGNNLRHFLNKFRFFFHKHDSKWFSSRKTIYFLTKNDQIAQTFNEYFFKVVNILEIFQLIQKFEKHPSINKIKQDFSLKTNFNLNLWITMNELWNVKKHIPNDRANGWEWYIYQYCKTVWFYHHIILTNGVY